MKNCLKWVHMARYGLILRLDGALWHTIILKPLLNPKRAMESSKIRKQLKHILELAKQMTRYAPLSLTLKFDQQNHENNIENLRGKQN